MGKPRAIPLPAIILIALLVQLATPAVARAEGETPPTEEQPAVEVSSESVPTVGEILEAAPAGTELMVVDPLGAPEPLATQQAAEALVESDPEWCPAGGGACTGPHTTLDALLDTIESGGFSGDGTIYFTTDYTDDDAYILGSDPRVAALQQLTIDGQGHVLSVPLEVTGWAYNVRVVNLLMDLTSYMTSKAALRIETTGAIDVLDVDVTNSKGGGAYLNNTPGTGSIAVTDSTFNANTWTGLDARSHGDIDLVNVVAVAQEDGAYLDASGGSGGVTVTGGTFGGNALAGLTARAAGGGIVVNGAASNANWDVDAYGIGLTGLAGGAIQVSGGSANQNAGRGLWIEGTGPVSLQGVTASDNGSDGAYIHNLDACAASPISVTVDGGTYQDNGGYGVSAVLGPNGAFTLLGAPVFSGNALGDYAVNLDPCPECDKEVQGEAGKPYNIVYVPETGSPPVPLDCEAYAGTVLILANGSRAKLTCPVSGEATPTSVAADSLPAPLPAARTFVSGISVDLTEAGLPVAALDEGGYLTLSFPIPEALKGGSLAILFWDPLTGAWVELPPYAVRPDGSPMLHRLHPGVTPDDLMYILGGVRVGRDTVKVKLTFGGTFVLVSR